MNEAEPFIEGVVEINSWNFGSIFTSVKTLKKNLIACYEIHLMFDLTEYNIVLFFGSLSIKFCNAIIVV